MIWRLKKLFLLIKNFLSSNLGKQLIAYSVFSLFLWGFHLIVISITSFFHFILDHNIRTIGDWIADKGWTLIMLSKILVFYLAMLFVNLKTNKMYSLHNYWKNSAQKMRAEIYVVLVFFLIAIIAFGQYKFNKTVIIALDRTLFSYVGTFVFFAVDYVLFIILDIFYPIEEAQKRKWRLFLLPLAFYFFSAMTFVYEQTISLKLYAFMFLLLYAGEWKRRNWTLALFFLLAFVAPMNAFFGFDPVWGEIYSPFIPVANLSTLTLFIVISFGVGYLKYSLKNKPEYIYRE